METWTYYYLFLCPIHLIMKLCLLIYLLLIDYSESYMNEQFVIWIVLLDVTVSPPSLGIVFCQ